MRIVITGARGFIGSNLSKYLAANKHEVVGLRRGNQIGIFDRIDLHTGEPIPGSSKSFAQHLEGANALILLGGKRQSPNSNAMHEFLEDNVIQLEKMIYDAMQVGVRKVIFASSIVACPLTSPVPYSESCTEFPDTLYGISKRLAEYVIEMHAKQGDYVGISLRLAQVFGTGHNNQGALALFVEKAINNEKIQVLGSGSAVRDYIYIKDVLSAFESALNTHDVSGPINIGSNEGYTIKDIALTVNRVFSNGQHPVEFKQVEKDDNTRYVMDCSKAREFLGWVPRWSLETALQDMRKGHI